MLAERGSRNLLGCRSTEAFICSLYFTPVRGRSAEPAGGQMKLFAINIIEHPDLAADEAWVVFDENAPQVPEDLRGNLSVPCILTGNRSRAERTLALLQAISIDQPLTTAIERARQRMRRTKRLAVMASSLETSPASV
jgi:hypothetical protein